MGEVPPQQTEFRFKVPGENPEQQFTVILSAFETFGFPTIDQEIITLLKSSNTKSYNMSITLTSKGFVKISFMVPDPPITLIESLCSLSGGDLTQFNNFQKKVNQRPISVEYQHLMKGFGYGVYKEGFDVLFHYKL